MKGILIPFSLLLSLLLQPSLALAAASTTPQSSYVPKDNFAINCGTSAATAADDGRRWTPDDGPSRFLTSQDLRSTSSAAASAQDYAPQVPYMTARLSRSPFSYSIPVSPGPIFLRLHFHPARYSSDIDASDALFSVSVDGRYTLLRNFSASLVAQPYFSREFCLHASALVLNITFVPSGRSLAFVNGIEVLSMPPDLYFDPRQVPIVIASGSLQTLPIDNSTALETVYRLNANGQAISPADDVAGLFRGWPDDLEYIYGDDTGQNPYNMEDQIRFAKIPNYTAPEVLYRTARSMGLNRTENENYYLTWLFPVDPGFFYLLRLHFCEIAEEITRISQRRFQIFLNNQTADDQMDIIVYAGGRGIPIYREFLVRVSDGGGEGAGAEQRRPNLRLALHPAPRSTTLYSDALLNGLEIFKLNKTDGTLAGPNPEAKPVKNSSSPAPSTGAARHPRKAFPVALLAGAAALAAVAAALCVSFCVISRRRKVAGKKFWSPSRSGGGSPWWCAFSSSGSELAKTNDLLPSHLCRRFTLGEIKAATDDFSAALVIGAGGFGKVYKGVIDNEDGRRQETVAIKRLTAASQQGAHEFRTEIEMLSQLRHRHLVPLIGYCDHHREMILVYDHMAHGALRHHLYGGGGGSDRPTLSWRRRLEICVGAARGLQYLHVGAKQPIIHRDVKTTNILLDGEWVAKVSDFGLSRVGPSNVSRTHVSTAVKGSFGYLDPEYYRRQQLTDKSDVYSFGVVLFEVLCGRAPLDRDLAKEEMCLSEWAREHYRSGSLDRIVDPNIREQIAPECLRAFCDVAYRCLMDHGIDRPSMKDVMGSLEFAMQLQDSADGDGPQKEVTDGCDQLPGESLSRLNTVRGASGGGAMAFDSGLGMSGSIFSELISPRGR